MKCSDLFENIKKHWPSEIDLDENALEKLNSIYWAFESKLDHDNEPWLDISSWSFHQAIDKIAKQEISQGAIKLVVSKIPMSLFNKQMLFNLDEDCWEQERQTYEQS